MQRATKQPAKRRPTAKPKPTQRTKSTRATPKRAMSRRPAAPRKPVPRADFGAPIDGFFARQPPHLRAILEELRTLVEAVVPDARSAIKWGMPWFSVGDALMCALGAHKAHVNLILAGPPGTYADPDGRLSGESKLGRHLKLTSVDELPRAAVRRWLRTAATVARGKG